MTTARRVALVALAVIIGVAVLVGLAGRFTASDQVVPKATYSGAPVLPQDDDARAISARVAAGTAIAYATRVPNDTRATWLARLRPTVSDALASQLGAVLLAPVSAPTNPRVSRPPTTRYLTPVGAEYVVTVDTDTATRSYTVWVEDSGNGWRAAAITDGTGAGAVE